MIESFFYKNRYVFLAVLVAGLLINVFRFYGRDFFIVLLGHVFLGQVLVCYIYGGKMVFGPAVVGEDDALLTRRWTALCAAACHVMLFVYKR